MAARIRSCYAPKAAPKAGADRFVESKSAFKSLQYVAGPSIRPAFRNGKEKSDTSCIGDGGVWAKIADLQKCVNAPCVIYALYSCAMETIRDQRKRLKLSQKALAERLGVAANTVARWERGEVPAPPMALRVISALVVVERLLGKYRFNEANCAFENSKVSSILVKQEVSGELKKIRDCLTSHG